MYDCLIGFAIWLTDGTPAVSGQFQPSWPFEETSTRNPPTSCKTLSAQRLVVSVQPETETATPYSLLLPQNLARKTRASHHADARAWERNSSTMKLSQSSLISRSCAWGHRLGGLNPGSARHWNSPSTLKLVQSSAPKELAAAGVYGPRILHQGSCPSPKRGWKLLRS